MVPWIIDEIPEIVGSLFVGDFFPGFGWIDELTWAKRMLMRSVRKMDAFYQEVIDEQINDERKKKGGDHEEDIVDVLISMWRGEHQRGSLGICLLFFLLVYTLCSN